MDTDFIPNKHGSFFNAFGSKSKTEEREEAAIKDAQGVLQQIIDRLNERIDFYKSVEAIDDDVTANPELLAQTVIANKLVVANLTQERNTIQGLIDK